MQTLLSLQDIDLRLEVEDGRRALVFHGEEIGGARIYTVRLLVCSDGVLHFILPDRHDWFYPSEVSAYEAGVHTLVDKCWMENIVDEEDMVILDDEED